MPTSPAPHFGKKGVALFAQGSTSTNKNNEKKLKGSRIDQQLHELEHDDGNRHSKELTLCLNKYTKTIDDLHEKNRRLEQELAFDDYAARNNPHFNEQAAEKLSNLYRQGNNVLARLELERKELVRLNALIKSQETIAAQQKSKLHELVTLDRNQATMLGRIRKMEHDIDHRVVKLNEKLNRNRQLRKIIDEHRAERARMDEVYTKMSTEMMTKTNKIARVRDEVAKLRQEIEVTEQEIESVRLEGEEWEAKCDRRAAILIQELKGVVLRKKDAKDLGNGKTFEQLGENELLKHVSKATQSEDQSPARRNKWKSGQAKVTMDAMLAKLNENRMFLEKMYEVSGTKTPSELIDAFNKQYPFQRAIRRVQYVNQLAEEIENHRQESTKMREEIGRLKQLKDSVDFEQMKRIEELRSKIQYTNEQKKVKDDANLRMQTFLDVLKPALFQFHSRIECASAHNGDITQVLSDIEEQLVNVLQAYHAKVESSKKDGFLQPPASTSPAVRRLSVAVGSRTRRRTTVLKRTAEKLGGGRLKSVAMISYPGSESASKAIGSTSLHEFVETGTKVSTTASVNAMISKEQPYRYANLRPPHLSVEELHKKDDVEEDYPLTYRELKAKVCQGETL
ncbi:putative ODA1/CCDC63 family protein [Plasmopara halstedii]